ncbi:phage late control D family protein [Siccibacter colletis]|uniref:Phage late control D family protein n=1 Tax=Siccibacter colletis TaxID=1505757 RepID=A0ABY6JF78_9ENTR|nr:phage late control D family protein [Siccibacter colletis]UYU32470.1 phage late control D family protein [Siccibacter colletis]
MIDLTLADAGAALAPDFTLTLSGKDITRNVSERLISLTLTDNRAFDADTLTLEIDDSDGMVELPARGAVLALSLGWKGSRLIDKGTFTVDGVTFSGAPDRVSIKAHSADFRGSLNVKREASYHNTTLSALVGLVAARNGLKSAVASTLADIAIAHIDQSMESDIAFLTRLAGKNGAEATIKNGSVLFLQPGRGTTVSGQPIAPLTITRRAGDSHAFTIADRMAYTGVIASWLNTAAPESQASSVTLQRKPTAAPAASVAHPRAQAPLPGGQGKREDYIMGEPSNAFVLTDSFNSKEEAVRAAKAKWDALQRSAATFSINLAMGRADLYPETPVTVSGFKRVIDAQTWTIKNIEHSLSDRGFTTKVVLEALLDNIEYEESISEG